MAAMANEVKNAENALRTELYAANHLTQREGRRQQWNKEFESHYCGIADTIAESITAAVLKKIGERLEDPFKIIPTSAYPLKTAFAFDISRAKNVSQIRSLAKDTADLEPFKEWFSVFGETKRAQLEPNKKLECEVEFEEMSSSLFPQSVFVTDREYFEEQMSKIGHRLENRVSEQLAMVGSRAENRDFRFKVEWYRKAEKTFGSFSGYGDNQLYVSTWIESKGAKK